MTAHMLFWGLLLVVVYILTFYFLTHCNQSLNNAWSPSGGHYRYHDVWCSSRCFLDESALHISVHYFKINNLICTECEPPKQRTMCFFSLTACTRLMMNNPQII